MTDAYHDHLTYLVAYANDDWVGFSPIVGAATALTRPAPTRDRVTDLVLGLISDLLATGVLAGDLTDSDDETFVP
uniref:hypothetical protein n=1 Tax=Gordonia sp. B7-2 TaxID=3420932 RepID=UPI003D91B2D6